MNIDKIIFSIVNIMKKFFISSAVGMVLILIISVVFSLPKEFIILGINGLIISLIGILLNDLALGKRKMNEDNSIGFSEKNKKYKKKD